MATTYTTHIALAMPGAGDRSWDVPLNANAQLLDKMNVLGFGYVRPSETPSTSLGLAVPEMGYVSQDGTLGNYDGGDFTMPANSFRYLYVDLTQNDTAVLGTGWPTTAHVRMAEIQSGPSSITAIYDARIPYLSLGSMLDGTEITIGSTNGYKIGTATTQKIGFLNATPAAQQTGGALTAAGTYGANEQSMLQKAYDALRTFGFLS